MECNNYLVIITFTRKNCSVYTATIRYFALESVKVVLRNHF